MTTKRANYLLVLAFALPILLFGLWPICILLFRSLAKAGSEGGLDVFFSLLLNASTRIALTNSLILAISTAVLSVLLAFPLSWIVVRTQIPGRKTLRILLAIPFAIPPYLGAIAWIRLANPSNGLINSVFALGLDVYSWSGLVLAMTGFFYATAFLVISTAMEKMDSSLEEAARIAGASPLTVLWKINLPLLRPTVLGAFMLVFLGALASYGVPALIGNPARISVVTTRIVSLQKVGSEARFQSAGLLSAALLLLSGLALLLFSRAERQSEAMVRGKAVRISLVDLGPMRFLAASLVWFFIFLVLGLPILTIAIAACSQTQGVLALSNFTLGHFSRVFLELDEVGRAFRNSFLLASVCATLATAFGFAIAYLAEKKKAPGSTGLIALANLPYSTPGTVLALGLIVAFSQPSFLLIPSLYNTLWLLGLAYIVKDLSYAVRTGRNSLGQIHESLDEAARICGAGRLSRWGRIWLPLLTPALAASWILIFLPAFSELTMSVLLSGPGLETVGTLLFQLQEYSDESGGGGAAVLALSLVVIALVLSIASQWLLRAGSRK